MVHSGETGECPANQCQYCLLFSISPRITWWSNLWILIYIVWIPLKITYLWQSDDASFAFAFLIIKIDWPLLTTIQVFSTLRHYKLRKAELYSKLP
jgi:hypothetical protein